MKTIYQLIKKEIRLFWADKVSVSLTFIVPIVLITVFGSIFGHSSGPRGIHLVFLNKSNAPIAKKLERTLDTMKTFILIKSYLDENGKQVPFDTTSAKEYVKKGSAGSALIIPEDAYSDTALGLKLKYYFDAKNDLETQLVQGMLQKTIMEQIPSMFTQSMQQQSIRHLGKKSGVLFNKEIAKVVSRFFNIDSSEVLESRMNDTSFISDTSRAINFFSEIVQMEKQQIVGKEIINPQVTRSVGGWAMMFLLFSISASAASLFDEKKSGVILRILSSPVTRVQILWSKYIFNIVLGIVQLLVMFVAGMLLFKIDIFSNLPNLLLIILLGAMTCTAFGMTLAAFTKSSAQASGWATFLILLMSSMGGAWWPSFLMPEFVQMIGKLTFVFWTIDGFLKVLWSQVPLLELLPNIAVLLGISVLFIGISTYKFKKGHVFEN